MLIIKGDPDNNNLANNDSGPAFSYPYVAVPLTAITAPNITVRVGDVIDWPDPIVTPQNASGWVLTGILVNDALVKIDVASQKLTAISTGSDYVTYVAENANGTTVQGQLTLTVNPALSALEARLSPAGSYSVNFGETFAFTAVASGGLLPYKYEFYVNNRLVASQDTATYAAIADDFGKAGKVHARVIDSNGMYVDTATTAFSIVAPAIVIQDFTRTVNSYVGKLTSFTPIVTGGRPPYTFVWLQDGVLTNKTTQAWIFQSVQKSDAGDWKLRVTDSLGTVQDSPGVVTHVVNATQLRVVKPASNTSQWPVTKTTDTNYALTVDLNATSAELTFDLSAFDYTDPAKPVIPNGTTDWAVQTQSANATTSKVSETQFKVTPTAKGVSTLVIAIPDSRSRASNINVTVARVPVISTQPTNQSVAAGDDATFTIALASNGDSNTIQWQKQASGASTWTNVTNATSATLKVTAVTAAMNGDKYRVVATNSDGTKTSNTATLTVT